MKKMLTIFLGISTFCFASIAPEKDKFISTIEDEILRLEGLQENYCTSYDANNLIYISGKIDGLKLSLTFFEDLKTVTNLHTQLSVQTQVRQ